MDELALAVGSLGLLAGLWATHVARQVAREGRFAERQIDAYVEIVRLVEQRTLWWKLRLFGVEVSDDPQYVYGPSSLPELPRQPDAAEWAMINVLLEAFGTERIKATCKGWTAALEDLEGDFEVVQFDSGPHEYPGDLKRLRGKLERLLKERERLGAVVRNEIEVAAGRRKGLMRR